MHVSKNALPHDDGDGDGDGDCESSLCDGVHDDHVSYRNEGCVAVSCDACGDVRSRSDGCCEIDLPYDLVDKLDVNMCVSELLLLLLLGREDVEEYPC